MEKKEILELLHSLVCTAYIAKYDKDDWSGCDTKYYVDQEQLLKNIQDELDEL